MKKEIKAVQDYFADKIARGLYKVVHADEHYITVIVDRVYKFKLWLGSTGWQHFSEWDIYFIQLNLTDEQKKSGHKIAIKHRNKLWVDDTKKKEIEQLMRLKEKYPTA